jgi:hypothetical protein
MEKTTKWRDSSQWQDQKRDNWDTRNQEKSEWQSQRGKEREEEAKRFSHKLMKNEYWQQDDNDVTKMKYQERQNNNTISVTTVHLSSLNTLLSSR